MANQINPDFALELREVKSAALNLQEGMNRHNFLPEDFPKAQIELHLLALGGLLDGSLEGAKLPLEHASVRLAEIRRRHFVHRSDVVDEENILYPTLERGGALDTRFTELLSAISTALDAFREQSRTQFDSLNEGDYLEILPRLQAQGKTFPYELTQLGDLATAARDSPWSTRQPVENVAVSAADARNVLATTQAEASADFVIRGWAKKLARGSADALNVLSRSLTTISVVGGVGYEFYLRYKSTISKIRDLFISEAKEWLKFLSEKVDDAEGVLRDYANGHQRGNYGMMDLIRGHRHVTTANYITFPVSKSQEKTPGKGIMVTFDLDNSATPPVAINIKQTSEFLLVEGELLTPEQAREPILKLIENYISERPKKMIPIRYLDSRFTAKRNSKLVPAKYWNVLGYDSIQDFINSCENLFAIPSRENLLYVSVEPKNFPKLSKKDVVDWTYKYLAEMGGRLSLGDLATASSRHFSDGMVPVRVQVGVDQFSSIFDGDLGLAIDSGHIEMI
ncbi:hypothetical protein [Agrobacterium leguminum]|uniref:hypothetical protein n=1 Tax=Agrobacterium leguminum TaxID=2792015 RepID=UPI003CE50606